MNLPYRVVRLLAMVLLLPDRQLGGRKRVGAGIATSKGLVNLIWATPGARNGNVVSGFVVVILAAVGAG